jgi:hypothetical protein
VGKGGPGTVSRDGALRTPPAQVGRYDLVYREDLLQIGAAGRLYLDGEIDDVLPLEDRAAWRVAKPVDGVIDPKANEARERAMANRLPRRAVIVLGVGHDLFPWLPGEVDYLVERMEALPAEK